ncbi:hypothetical protein BQ8794_260020 [Mesorhizobium prunaredense]|uniref:Uncharacterized protein n=1 Tax=Mesorhizobium prunaredense TaxID=1631249 RepID=A0A1R3V8K7_9HYPH|nr:PIN domain-containing protein [Mesorhizobium prunaredense]SIT56164.1 hypothetical protein BQ8794_260020 [Mesorhizobium prunaredense]
MTTVVELLAAEQVTFCVDTNILIEFQALASLPWHELAPAATSIRIIVPTKVGAEMDEHKFSSGRLRKRAAEFSDLVRRLEQNNYAPINLRDARPLVTFEFGALFKAKDLDGEQFELTDADNRVVAEVFRTSVDVPALVFMADAARSCGRIPNLRY